VNETKTETTRPATTQLDTSHPRLNQVFAAQDGQAPIRVVMLRLRFAVPQCCGNPLYMFVDIGEACPMVPDVG